MIATIITIARRWLPWITVVAGLTAGTGVSAQSVQAVLPEVVKGALIIDEYLTGQYERLVLLLIQAIK